TTGVRITLSLVTAGDSRTVDVVALVQLAVLAAVRHALDRDDVHVEVFVTDVDLTSLYGGSSVTSRPSR
ncbi:MAG: hypothetical protein ACRDRL_19660, partial [Sciscionella sp.]